MSLPSRNLLAASHADRPPRRAAASPKNSLNESCGFAVCAEREVQVNPARCDLSNSADRNLKECCSRALLGATSAARSGLSVSLPTSRKFRS